MKKIKVKIMHCTINNYWYAKQVGNTVNVYESEDHPDDYIFAQPVDESYFILKSDCEVIEEATPQPEPFDLDRAKKGEFILCDGDMGKYMFTNTHPDGTKHIFQLSVNGANSQAQAVIFYSERDKRWFGGFNSHELPYTVTMAPKEPEFVEGWVVVYPEGIAGPVYATKSDAIRGSRQGTWYIHKIRFPKP